MDAINGGQLYGALDSTAQMLGGGAAVTAFGTISAPTYMVQGGNYFKVGDALSALDGAISGLRSEEHTSEIQSLMRSSYAVVCLKKKKIHHSPKNILNKR